MLLIVGDIVLTLTMKELFSVSENFFRHLLFLIVPMYDVGAGSPRPYRIR